MFSRILVPLDGSRLAEAALPVAERLAAAFGATVVLLHVVERGAHPTIHGNRHFTDQATAEDYLQRLADDLGSRGVSTTIHVHGEPEGDVAASIALHGSDESAELIVLCTHGSGGVRNLLWGSIAQQVLHRGVTPVLLVRVPPGGVPASVFAPKTVLVPLDATAASEAALAPAMALAVKLGARLHIAMVVPTLSTLRGERAATAILSPLATGAILDLEQAQAERYLDQLSEKLAATGITIETEVRRGDAVSELAGEAVEHDVGLVVASTHGRAGLETIWTGSVVARLLARTAAPVLLLRIVEG